MNHEAMMLFTSHFAAQNSLPSVMEKSLPNKVSTMTTFMKLNLLLTHWGRVTHICVSKLSVTGSDNDLSPDRRQAIIWTNAEILLIGLSGTNVSDFFFIEIDTFSFKKMYLKMSSGKWRPFCLGLNVLKKMKWYGQMAEMTPNSGVILCMLPTNERRRNNVTSYLISWVHTQKYPSKLRDFFTTLPTVTFNIFVLTWPSFKREIPGGNSLVPLSFL